jgi:hypothetical protein
MDRCRDLRALFPAYAADRTSRGDAMRVQLHLGDGCAACAVELEQLMEAFHAVPLGLTPAAPGPGTRQSLLDEVGATPQEAVQVPDLYPDNDPNRLWKVLVGLAALALFAAAWWGQGQLDEVARLRGEVTRAAMTSGVDTRSLERQVSELKATLQAATSPTAVVVDLTGDAGRARLFLDDEGDVATIASRTLGGAPDDGQLHHLWLVQGEQVSLLGRLPPAFSQRGGQLRFHMPDGLGDGVSAIITADPWS